MTEPTGDSVDHKRHNESVVDPKMWRVAAAAAATRAQECRLRADRLRDGAGSSTSDVDVARQRLADAQRRAARASDSVHSAARSFDTTYPTDSRRSAVSMTWFSGTALADASPHEPTPGEYSELAGRIKSSGLSIDDVWLKYVALAGSCSSLELDAALHNALVLPLIEYQVLQQVVWENERFA